MGENQNDLNTFHGEITSLLNSGWRLESINGGDEIAWWIIKRPLEQE